MPLPGGTGLGKPLKSIVRPLRTDIPIYLGAEGPKNVALTAVHVVWHREHNFQAEQIKALHPDWTAEQIFQAAKIVQTAQYQRIVFTEFAEALSGGIPGPSHGFGGYNPNVNPGISDEFAGAMYRVGHSMINETIPFTDAAGNYYQVPRATF